MTFIQKFTKYWLSVILWMCFISWMSTGTFSKGNTFFWVEKVLSPLLLGISSEGAEWINVVLRRAGHITGYFILGLLLFRAFRGGSAISRNRHWFCGVIIVVFLSAAIDEFHQSLVSSRTASLADVGIDAAGGLMGLFVIVPPWLIKRRNSGLKSTD